MGVGGTINSVEHIQVSDQIAIRNLVKGIVWVPEASDLEAFHDDQQIKDKIEVRCEKGQFTGRNALRDDQRVNHHGDETWENDEEIYKSPLVLVLKEILQAPASNLEEIQKDDEEMQAKEAYGPWEMKRRCCIQRMAIKN
jgi:hypothetical protein